jgi:single-strand DNA-binding protein
MTWATVTVCGNLGAKPTIKYFESGNSVSNLVLYVNRPRHHEDEPSPPLKLYTEVWGKQAESCANLLDKGSRVTVTGSLDEETYTDREGNPATILKIRYAQVLDYGPKPTGDRPTDPVAATAKA